MTFSFSAFQEFAFLHFAGNKSQFPISTDNQRFTLRKLRNCCGKITVFHVEIAVSTLIKRYAGCFDIDNYLLREIAETLLLISKPAILLLLCKKIKLRTLALIINDLLRNNCALFAHRLFPVIAASNIGSAIEY